MSSNVNELILNELDSLMELMAQTFHRSGAAYLSGLNLTFPQFMVLKLIHLKVDPKMTDLADELSVTLGNMTPMTDRLIEHGYVIRKDDAADRRIVRVCLTAKGTELLKKAAERRKKNMGLILDKMSHADRGGLLKIIKNMAQAIMQSKEEIE
ncbi:MAG: MarR family transcriptional regulator [Candidatus Margulisbacteria bacterium]|nr:MarR family transcriptional regulator [Candidatus Margulisiibacteriota bacterium]